MSKVREFELGYLRPDRGVVLDKGNFGVDPLHPDFSDLADIGDGAVSANAAFLRAQTYAAEYGLAIAPSPGVYVFDADITLSSPVLIRAGVVFQVAATKTVTLSGSLVMHTTQAVAFTGSGTVNPTGEVLEPGAGGSLPAGTYTGAYTFNNVLNAWTGASFAGGTFTGDGSALTDVVVTAGNIGAGTYANALTLSNAANVLHGNGANLTGVVVTADNIAAGTYTNALTLNNVSNVLYGDGSNLTGISGSGSSPFFDVTEDPYNATGNGTSDDATAISSAHTAATASGGILYFPAGTYRIAASITFNSDVAVLLAPGAVIKPDAARTLTVNGEIMSGHWQIFDTTNGDVVAVDDCLNDYINVFWFDGADIGAKANNAITAVGGTAINRRHTLRFPRGKHTLSTKIDMDGVSQVALEGSGRMQTHLEIGASLTIVGISLLSSDECEVNNLRVTEASGSIVSTILQVTGTSFRMSDCFFGNASVGVQCGDGTTNAGVIGEFDHIIVESCKNNWILEGTTRNAVFTSCFGNAGNAAATTDAEWLIRASGGSSPSFITFQGCKAEQGSGDGWLVESGSNFRWHGCQVRNMVGRGIAITGGNGRSMIVGCDIEDNATGGLAPGIYVDVERVKVVGNMLVDNGTLMQGIHFNTNSTLCEAVGNGYRSVATFEVQNDGAATNSVEGLYEGDLAGATPNAAVYQQGHLVYDNNATTKKLWLMRQNDAGADEITLS